MSLVFLSPANKVPEISRLLQTSIYCIQYSVESVIINSDEKILPEIFEIVL